MARAVSDGVYVLDISWPEPIGSNAYLVDDGDVTLVDAGLPVPRRPISKELTEVGYSPADLDRVLLTHYDIDHVGGLGRLGLGSNLPVYLGSEDAALVRREWSPPWTHHKGAFHRLTRRIYSLSSVDLHPVEDGDSVGGFRAIHAPGHNPGHTVYIHEESGAAFLGDLVWESDGAFVAPPWLDSYDTDTIADSIARVAEESFDHACVGHGRPVTPDADAVLRELAADL
ncbi:MBL fold metallo-hydrolase [Natronomonas amylolytica]|uniref:MBL fold metallo-hydrolase n=1 Tax=Natronomonas amylolytica TaxID=3108498 RepID=UPI0030080CE9